MARKKRAKLYKGVVIDPFKINKDGVIVTYKVKDLYTTKSYQSIEYLKSINKIK